MSDEAFTIFCRNLTENVSEEILYELFLQAGPVEDVRIPKRDGKNRNFGFVVFKHKASVKYALELFRDTKLYGRTITLQNRLLDAERVAEIKAMSWRNDEINCLRGGGPPPNLPRLNDMNALRGGMSSNYSRDNDSSYLRAGPSGISTRDNMLPRGHGNIHNRFDSKSDRSSSMDPRFMNPYSNPYMNYSDNDSRGSSSMRCDDISSLRGGPSGISIKDNMMPRGHSNNSYNRSPKYERDNTPDPRFMNPYKDYSDIDKRGASSSHDRHNSRRYSEDKYDRNSRDRCRKDRDDFDNLRGKRDRDDFSRRNTYRDDGINDLRNKLRRSKSRDRSPLSSDRNRTR